MAKNKLLFLLCGLLATGNATAQHGLTLDIGKNHKEDSTRVTSLSIGLISHTDTLRARRWASSMWHCATPKAGRWDW